MAENAETTPTAQDELEERWIFGDGEGGLDAAEYVIHLGKPAFVAQIVDVGEGETEGFDLEFVRWFDPQPTDDEEIDRLVNLAAEAIQRHDEELEALEAEEDDDVA